MSYRKNKLNYASGSHVQEDVGHNEPKTGSAWTSIYNQYTAYKRLPDVSLGEHGDSSTVLQSAPCDKELSSTEYNLTLFRAGRHTIGDFRYIKIQLDSEVQRTQTKEMNKNGHSISFVCVL